MRMLCTFVLDHYAHVMHIPPISREEPMAFANTTKAREDYLSHLRDIEDSKEPGYVRVSNPWLGVRAVREPEAWALKALAEIDRAFAS